jgi:serine protease Do
MSKHFISGFVGALIGAILVILYLQLFWKPQISSPTAGPPPPVTSIEQNPVTRAVEIISPSVVNIDMKAFATVTKPSNPFGIFGFPGDQTYRAPRMGSGSGVIIDSKGLVLTNEHVIHGASEILVTLSDEKRFPGIIKGADQLSDIAIVEIKAKDLIAARLGNSDDLKIGETVIAVGNPYKFQHTVTMGVLSGRGRSLSEHSKDFQDLLQTDAAINPGNSGGPLVNTHGEVIGINTAIVPYAQGIGFAIPVNTARNVMEQLLSHGKVRRPHIGIYMQDMNRELGDYIGASLDKGVIIVDVIPESPAARAGLAKLDVIVSINGVGVNNAEDLRKILKTIRIGDTISLDLWRKGKTGTISLQVGETP